MTTKDNANRIIGQRDLPKTALLTSPKACGAPHTNRIANTQRSPTNEVFRAVSENLFYQHDRRLDQPSDSAYFIGLYWGRITRQTLTTKVRKFPTNWIFSEGRALT